MQWVRPGDVLRRDAVTGPIFRVVREVTRRRDGSLLCVTFAKRRRSRYERPDTTLHSTDLKTLGFYAAGVRLKLDGKLDRRFAAFLATNENRLDRPYRDRYTVTEDEALGLP